MCFNCVKAVIVYNSVRTMLQTHRLFFFFGWGRQIMATVNHLIN